MSEKASVLPVTSNNKCCLQVITENKSNKNKNIRCLPTTSDQFNACPPHCL